MRFFPTFDSIPEEDCMLWAVSLQDDVDEEGDQVDIFYKLMEDWTNAQYLSEFFAEHIEDLKCWESTLTIDDAINWAIEEALEMEAKLIGIVTGEGEYLNLTLGDVFQPLHEGLYGLRRENESLKKGKANHNRTMLRFYAVELDDVLTP